MAIIDKEYHKLLEVILDQGYKYEDPNRKGTYRTEIDEYTIRHDLTKGFPAITTKELHWKSVVGELIWFLRGDTNIKYLVDNGINIWNKDAYNYYCKVFKKEYPHALDKLFDISTFTLRIKEDKLKSQDLGKYTLGDLGPIYGQQWRKIHHIEGTGFNAGGGFVTTHKYVDQLSNLIKNLKENPLATDHIVNAWNVVELEKMGLKPCHFGFQIMVRPLNPLQWHNLKREQGIGEDRSKLPRYGFTLKWDQRSVDTFLGLPFNIASYATLAHVIGKLTNMVPLKLVGSLSKVHIYDNAIEKAYYQLGRGGVDKFKAPTLKFSKGFLGESNYVYEGQMNLDRFLDRLEIEDFELDGYESYPKLTAKMLAYNK